MTYVLAWQIMIIIASIIYKFLDQPTYPDYRTSDSAVLAYLMQLIKIEMIQSLKSSPSTP